MLRAALMATVAALMIAVLPFVVLAESDRAEPSESPGDATDATRFVYATARSPDAATELVLHLAHSPIASDGGPVVIDLAGSAVRDPEALAERGVTVIVPLYWDEWPGGEPPKRIEARARAEAVACAVRFARAEYGSETAPLVLTGFSFHAGLASHVALAGESFERAWEQYAETNGGPPTQFDCTASETPASVDGFVGVAGPYDALMGLAGGYGPRFPLYYVPDVWEVLDTTVGQDRDLRVRLLHGDADPVVPLEATTTFGNVLAEAGYDVEVVEFDGDHTVPSDLMVEAIIDLVS